MLTFREYCSWEATSENATRTEDTFNHFIFNSKILRTLTLEELSRTRDRTPAVWSHGSEAAAPQTRDLADSRVIKKT